MQGQLKLKTTDQTGVYEATLNGHDLSSITATAHITARAGCPPYVTIEIPAIRLLDLDLAGAETEIAEETRQLLIALGWTPPGGTP